MKRNITRILVSLRTASSKPNLRNMPKFLCRRGSMLAILLVVISLMMSTASPIVSSGVGSAAQTATYPSSVQTSPSSIIESIPSQDKATFMYFYDDWCHVCQEQKPIIDKLEQEYAQQITFVRVNGADGSELIDEFGVTGFPSMFLVSDQTRKEFRGFTTEEMLRESFEQAISSGSTSIVDSSNSMTGTTGVNSMDYSCSSSDPDVHAEFSWYMPKRFGDFDNDGMTDSRKTVESINPPNWLVSFSFCTRSTNSDGYPGSSGLGDPMDYYWFVDGEPVGGRTGCGAQSRFEYDFPSEGTYEVTLAVVDGNNCDMMTQVVTVQDWLIVGVGDSFASGDGNPDISVEDALEQVQTALEDLAQAASSAQQALAGLETALTNFSLLPDWENQPFEDQVETIQDKLTPALDALNTWKYWCVDQAPWKPEECAAASDNLASKLTELGLEGTVEMIAQGSDYIRNKIEALFNAGQLALSWAQQMYNLEQAVVNAANSLIAYRDAVAGLAVDSRKFTRTQAELDQLNQDLAALLQKWDDFLALRDNLLTIPEQLVTEQTVAIQNRIQPALDALDVWQQACTNDPLSEDCLLPFALIDQLQNLGFVSPIDFLTKGYEYIRSTMQALVDVNQVALDRAETLGNAVQLVVDTASTAADLISQVGAVIQALLTDFQTLDPRAIWQDLQCKRSATSGQAQAALAIENADPHTSVTFVHLACSGATVNEGLIGPYEGAVPEAGEPLVAQIDAVKTLVGDRQIDALLVSVGGNDLGFKPIVMSAIPLEPSNSNTPEPDPLIQAAIGEVCSRVGAECGLLDPIIGCTSRCTVYLEGLVTGGESAKQIYEKNIPELAGYYEALRDKLLLELPGLMAKRVYLTEYPNPARDDDGTSYCGWDVTDPLKMLPGVSENETEWAEGTVLHNLNEAVANATGKWGWNYVSGIYEDTLSHGYCADDHFVRRLYESLLIQTDEGGTLHPNREGHQVYKEHIVEALTPDLYPGGQVRLPYDADGDGIEDPVDGGIVAGKYMNQETVFSSNFTDQHLLGTSYGSILERNGLKVQVKLQVNDEYIREGFFITTTGDDGPVAEVSVCDLTLHLTNGDEVIATCGSLTLEVLSGPVEIVLDGITVTVPGHTTVIITEVTPGSFRIENSSGSQGKVSINIRGTVVELDPGEILDVPKIAITKVTVDGATEGDGLNILAGESLSWKYTVENNGNVLLRNVSVTDSEGVTVTCPKATLAVGESMTCTASGTATAGDYSNTGNATGSYTDFKVPTPATATGNSSYFGANPQIDIVKKTVGSDGSEGDNVLVLVGETVTWKYYVTNTGNVALSNVTVTDSKGVTVTCPQTTLAVGESMTCTTTGTATPGSYSNTGTATTDPYMDSAGHTRTPTDSDGSSYVGIPKGAVTSSSLCEFDVSSDPGQQFRLLFTPDTQATVFKLNASNPGQFYYSAFFYASSPGSVNITIPYPFVTQGATPIYVYSSVTAAYGGGKFCFAPGTEISSQTNQIVLGGNDYDSFGDTKTLTVDFPNAGLLYVAVHLDYGLKKTAAYSKDAVTLRATGITGTPAFGTTIPNLTNYAFSDNKGGSDAIQSVNEFKKDPGVGGLVLKSGTGDPIADSTVEIWLGSEKMAAVKTDADGWYMWNYKYTGKAATFTVKSPAYNLSHTATLKSNGFLVVNFAVP